MSLTMSNEEWENLRRHDQDKECYYCRIESGCTVYDPDKCPCKSSPEEDEEDD